MKKMILLVLLGSGLVFFGCNKATEHSADDGHGHEGHGHEVAAPLAAGHEVDGWCVEHEVPEDICSLCNGKVAAEYKQNGDWCKEHNRAESQCFICDSNRKEKFIAQYEAKYGKKPPAGK
jgi:hypothetical protein